MRCARILALAASLTLSPALLEAQGPALSIDGAPVSFERFACWLIPFQGESNLARFCDLQLLERAAAAEGIVVSRAEIEEAVESVITQRVAGAFEGDRAAWRAALERLGSTEAGFRAGQKLDSHLGSLTSRLVDKRRTIDEDRLRAAWEEKYGPNGRAPDLRWIHLEVPPPSFPPGATRVEIDELARLEREKIEARALELIERHAKGADFETLARAHSEDPYSREKGGKIPGSIALRSFGNEGLVAIEALFLGEVSAPLYARGGYNLFHVAGEIQTPFESVAAALESELRFAAPDAGETTALLAELHAGIELEVLPTFYRNVQGEDATPASWRMDQPVLRLNGELLTRGEFAAWLCAARGKPFVRTYAQMQLTEQRAHEAGIEISAAEVDRRVYEDLERTIEVYFDGELERWEAHLESSGLGQEGHLRTSRIKTRHDFLAERLLLAERTIDEATLRRMWEDRYGPGGASLDVRFLMRTLPEPPEGTLETQEQLDRYLAEARAEQLSILQGLSRRIENGEDFATLVKLYSQDATTRDRGGRPEGRFELHTWSPVARDAIEALRPGSVTEPIEMGFDSFLFQLVGTRVVPFEEVRNELARERLEARPSMVEVKSFVNALMAEHEARPLPGMYERQPGPRD